MTITLTYDPAASEAAAKIIGAVRHAFHGSRACPLSARKITAWESALPAIGAGFRGAQAAMLEWQGAGLIVAPPGTIETTRHERRLLQAAGAAQNEEDGLVDNFLCKLAPHPRARPVLTRAVTTLANSLAGCGHWLSAAPLPAPALRLMRLRGADPARLAVAWPASGGTGVGWAGTARWEEPS
ncbi:hypothetical protein ACLRDC_13670 [Gluconacetobacter sacchari]|uniref:hypothetical protein n=1 Tax=Gluconacetobacter sacchari TaxID=92759 RepID=UPI0039B36668